MKNIVLYTDGACSGNPGIGGYGIVLIYNNYIKEFNGYEKETTNNKMEVTAVIEGLKKIKEPCNVDIYTDSAYTMNAFSEGWIDNWIKNNWKTANNKPVKNDNLWKSLLKEMERHNITWHKVKGHSDNVYNNRCDELARAGIDECRSILNEKKEI